MSGRIAQCRRVRACHRLSQVAHRSELRGSGNGTPDYSAHFN